MSRSLSCPTCGAPASGPTAAHCDYCGSVLTVTSCPSCFGTMFAGMEFCPTCGTRASRIVDDSAAPLACPGCAAGMHVVTVGVTVMHECADCASLWIDAGTFTQLCTTREARGAVVAFIGVERRTPQSHSAPTAGVRYVPCPACKKLMNRQNFGRRSGVIVDVCKGHGVWFEQNELPAALRFIDSGGFEKARLAESERQSEEHAKLLQQFNASGQEFRTLEMQDRLRAAHGVPGSASSDSESVLSQALRALLG